MQLTEAQFEAQRLEIACFQRENERLREELKQEHESMQVRIQSPPDGFQTSLLAMSRPHRQYVLGLADEIERLRDENDWLRRKLAVYEAGLAKAGGEDE